MHLREYSVSFASGGLCTQEFWILQPWSWKCLLLIWIFCVDVFVSLQSLHSLGCCGLSHAPLCKNLRNGVISIQILLPCGKHVLRSDGISQKWGALIVRYGIARKSNEFILFFIVLRIIQLLITLKPLIWFRWCFQQNVAVQMSTSIN